MKTSIAAILALAGAATVAAVEFPPNVPGCDQECGNNMFAADKAEEFKCKADDHACICKHQEFGNGIRDCSMEHCGGNVDNANLLINWAVNYCKDAGAAIAIAPVGGAAGTGAASGNPATPTGGAGAGAGATATGGSDDDSGAGATATGGSDNDSGDATATAIATSTWTSIFTSGDATSTVTGTTTVSGVNGVPVGGAIGGGNGGGNDDGPETTVTAPIVSTHTGESTTFETTIGSTTLTGDDAQNTGAGGQGGQGGQGGASSTSSSALGAQMTAAPAFGFLAAAGIAAALL
ncbi:hypothetical protein B0I37DRAFT_132281 [Chaetomium sp. MPI-CAGE-AT-0009]|nr:hypothetical protein B0I37DRAFT_132281 [Chaetomium sp. MPI-CAGE-AT-0009]